MISKESLKSTHKTLKNINVKDWFKRFMNYLPPPPPNRNLKSLSLQDRFCIKALYGTLFFGLFFKELVKCTESTKSVKVSSCFSPTLTGPIESLMTIKKHLMRSVLQLQHYQAKRRQTLSVSFLKRVLQFKKKKKITWLLVY